MIMWLLNIDINVLLICVCFQGRVRVQVEHILAVNNWIYTYIYKITYTFTFVLTCMYTLGKAANVSASDGQQDHCPAVLWLMNSFNKTEAAVFSCRLCFLGAFPFVSLGPWSGSHLLDAVICESGKGGCPLTNGASEEHVGPMRKISI